MSVPAAIALAGIVTFASIAVGVLVGWRLDRRHGGPHGLRDHLRWRYGL